MTPHTTWYPADEPDDAPPPPPPLHSPTLPFRFVIPGSGTPYPVHEAPEPGMVDLLSGDQWHRGGSLRQPVAEDFLRPQKALPAPPVEGRDEEIEVEVAEPDDWVNEVPATEPDSYFHDVPVTSQQPSHLQSHATELDRRDTIAPLSVVIPSPVPERPNTAPPRPESAQSESAVSERQDTPTRVPAMANDFFSPVLGGLQRLPSTPQKESKSERVRRFFSFRRRKYGRASR